MVESDTVTSWDSGMDHGGGRVHRRRPRARRRIGRCVDGDAGKGGGEGNFTARQSLATDRVQAAPRAFPSWAPLGNRLLRLCNNAYSCSGLPIGILGTEKLDTQPEPGCMYMSSWPCVSRAALGKKKGTLAAVEVCAQPSNV